MGMGWYSAGKKMHRVDVRGGIPRARALPIPYALVPLLVCVGYVYMLDDLSFVIPDRVYHFVSS